LQDTAIKVGELETNEIGGNPDEVVVFEDLP
jgi:hypothetical protein